MIEIKEGDFVLVDHAFIYDAYQVRRVDKVMKSQCVLSKPVADEDGFTDPGRRKSASIRAVFKSEAQAIAAIPVLRELKEQLYKDEKALKQTFHKACLGLCG